MTLARVNGIVTGVFYDSWAAVPKRSDDPTLPLHPCVNGVYTPSLSISASGTSIDFIMTFTGGTAYFLDVVSGEWDDPAPMAGWTYGIAININYQQIYAEDVKNGLPVPPAVLQAIDGFTSDGFDVFNLFIDFMSVDLLKPDPAKTTTGSGDDAYTSFVNFMGQYLKGAYSNRKENPFILGYTSKLPASQASDRTAHHHSRSCT